MSRQSLIQRALERLNLRFPTLFVLLLALTLVDLAVPDLVPFADEAILALLTVLVGLWKDRRAARTGRGTRGIPAARAAQPSGAADRVP